MSVAESPSSGIGVLGSNNLNMMLVKGAFHLLEGILDFKLCTVLLSLGLLL